MLNKMVPPYEAVVAVDTPVEDMTEKEMLKEILMRERNRVFGLSKVPKLFFVITEPDTAHSQSDVPLTFLTPTPTLTLTLTLTPTPTLTLTLTLTLARWRVQWLTRARFTLLGQCQGWR